PASRRTSRTPEGGRHSVAIMLRPPTTAGPQDHAGPRRSTRLMPRLRLLTLLCMAALAAPATASAAPEAGINVSLPFTQADLANAQASGPNPARFFMFTTTDPAQSDGPVADLAKIGVKPVFVIVGDPSNPPTTPAAVADYAAFVGRAAAHFRGQAAAWEIWN